MVEISLQWSESYYLAEYCQRTQISKTATFCLKIQGFEFLIGDHVKYEQKKKEIACFQMTHGQTITIGIIM